VCEDSEKGYTTKPRDFAENETVAIPWSCSVASTPVHIFRIKITVNKDVGVKEDIENEEEIAVMAFENGESILELDKT
jgi:hypothetical protein